MTRHASLGRSAVRTLAAALFLLPLAQAQTMPDGDWWHHGRVAGGGRFSPLTQITTENVAKLERAWTINTGDFIREGNIGRNVFECAPIAVDGVLFVITPFQRCLALDAATGETKWAFDPGFDVKNSGGQLASRGVEYRRDGDSGRIYLPIRDGRVFSLDAQTGKPDPAFGDNGVVDIKKLIGAGDEMFISSPPVVYRDVLIQGYAIDDSHRDKPQTPLVAIDARTGKERWRFNTVPQNDEPGAQTWEKESWRNRGGCNVWSIMSVDESRGLVYLPVTECTFDFYGGDRPGANLYSNCVVALDALTGEKRWHFQTIHHSLWDYDLPAQPVLVDLVVDGKPVPAVAQVGKTGFVYLFNRETGEPVFPIEERPVPQSDAPGEQAWPTQPFPTKPPAFTPQHLSEANLSRLDPETHAYVSNEFKKYRSEGLFTPPSLQGTILSPGFHGGANWSGAAVDPRTGKLYVNSTELPCIVALNPEKTGSRAYSHTGYIRFRDQNGYPACQPPWGQLNAIDLGAGSIAWQKPLGEFPELKARGIPTTGQENFGGATVTAGGLVFIASTMDEKFRAFDSTSGEILFETTLDFAGYAPPVSYLGKDGRQYVVICAGGGGKLETKSGDAIIAFALPKP